jgi:subtilisin family serine protease
VNDFLKRPQLPPVFLSAVHRALAETIDWGLAAYRVPDHWRETRGQGVRVAVIDTGIDVSHPDLREALDDARDFTKSRAGPRDENGHGTHVAGIVAARRNQIGVVGVAPECRLLSAKVLNATGAGQSDWVAAGIDWAAAAGADILSLSFGAPERDPAIAAAVDRAAAQGKIVICAAGNAGLPNSVSFPARMPNVVAVGAVNRDGQAAHYSSAGKEVDICAPGEDILSTYLGGAYARLSGTSMAAPFVSGVVALLLARERAAGGRGPANIGELLDRLGATAVDAGPRGLDPQYGFGLIDPGSLLTGGTAASPVECEIGPLRINGVLGKLVFEPAA